MSEGALVGASLRSLAEGTFSSLSEAEIKLLDALPIGGVSGPTEIDPNDLDRASKWCRNRVI